MEILPKLPRGHARAMRKISPRGFGQPADPQVYSGMESLGGGGGAIPRGTHTVTVARFDKCGLNAFCLRVSRVRFSFQRCIGTTRTVTTLIGQSRGFDRASRQPRQTRLMLSRRRSSETISLQENLSLRERDLSAPWSTSVRSSARQYL